MEHEIRNRPAFANLLMRLTRGDRLLAEAGSMASMSSAITVRPRFAGGFWMALLRKLFGGESLFMNEISTDSGGELVLTQATPGDMECLALNGQGLYLQPGAFIACDASIHLSLGWAGIRSFLAREGLFRLKVSGHGRVWFGGYGGIITKDIQGEYVVDSSHLVAYEPSIGWQLGLSGGIATSLLGGEGLVMRLRGPGRVYLQTRSIDALAAWVNSHLY